MVLPAVADAPSFRLAVNVMVTAVLAGMALEPELSEITKLVAPGAPQVAVTPEGPLIATVGTGSVAVSKNPLG